MTSSPRWLMALMVMRPDFGLRKGREVSPWRYVLELPRVGTRPHPRRGIPRGHTLGVFLPAWRRNGDKDEETGGPTMVAPRHEGPFCSNKTMIQHLATPRNLSAKLGAYRRFWHEWAWPP